MLKINEETLEIEIVESLSFECQVLPVIEDLKSDLSYDLDCFDEDDQENIQNFLNQNELSNEAKLKILNEIKEYYETRDNYYENVSLFDEEVIKEGFYRWFEETYEVDIRS